MTARRTILAGLAACLLAGLPATGAEPAAPELPAELTQGLSADQLAILAAWAKDAFCYCGCPHTVLQCLREHKGCRHAKRMVTLAARLVRAGAKRADLERALEAYYGSFDKRAKLDVGAFGPPLGSPDAPIAIVEFSDFQCPYCQMVRPILETFVRARTDRVRLYYKPFPIESHPGAHECAEAAEWARAKGRFWAMHDTLFENPGARTVGDLADLARGIGLEPAELRQALSDHAFADKVRASQAEARAAGIRGTPTLFLAGRMLVNGEYTEDGLEFTLQDEEEWHAHHGWTRD